jgi:hypothetical protein
MSGLADPADTPTCPGEPPSPSESPPQESSPPSPAADEARIHLYEAVSTQRDKVLDSFDAQRAAILKAVADQHAAALAPIMAVNAKRATQPRAAPTTHGPMLPSAGSATPSGSSTTQAGARRQLIIAVRRAAAEEIVAALKTLVAAEVRAQLEATSSAGDSRQRVPRPDT